jgi:hypothetical protein
MKKKRQYNEKVKRGDKSMIWQPPATVEWESKRGQFKNKSDGLTATNADASENPSGDKVSKEDVIKAYAKYLKNARQADGTYDWTEWNAKRLVWDLGNQKTLAAIRNTVSDFCDTLGMKLTTLRAGNAKKAMTAAQKKATYSEWVSSDLLQELAVSE